VTSVMRVSKDKWLY